VIVARPLKDLGIPEGDIIWSQSFYYGMWAAILYFIDASLLTITLWGACTAHYGKALLLTTSQRTLMLQSIMLLLYLLLGAYIFSEIESWYYLDAVYWAVVTLFTVGFGDYYPETDLGRGLLIPFALAGIISLGLVISSVRNLILEEGSRCVTTRIGNKKREKTIRKILLSGGSNALDPIHDDFQTSITRPYEPRQSEFQRRKAEFLLMRRIQAEASTRRRWVAMAISTFSWLVLWLLGAVVFYKAERTYQGWSYFDAFYFCFEAWTTIGYGDLSPVSNAGRSFYVFWSLLALPTMTVLISNASNTVVRIIRDITVLVGNITILPNDRPFIRNMRGLINKLTFGRLFSDQDSESSISTTCEKDTHRGSIGNMERFHNSSQHRDSRSLATPSLTGHLVPPLTVPLNTKFSSLSTPDLSNCVQEFTTAIDFQLLLISEIRAVTGHLQESRPHHYTFDEWAWYLKLLGEDEHSPETHCGVNPGRGRPDSSQDGSSSGLKWSWVGDQSPLLNYELESEWVLGRLIDKLRESLVSTRRLQLEDRRRLPPKPARLQQY
jgi:potassium channel subfamily K